MTADQEKPAPQDAPFAPLADARPDDAPWEPLAWPPASDIELVGDVVRLFPVDPQRDAAELFSALDDDAVWAHVAGRPGTAAEFAASFENAIRSGRLPWAVQLIDGQRGFGAGALVGTTSFHDISVPDARLEIGYTTYARPCWGSLVNPDTKRLLLDYAFETLGAGRVQIKTDIRNERSQRAIERLGAVYEGTLRRYQRRSDGSIRDTVMFSITAEDWPEADSRLRARLAHASPGGAQPAAG